jgi:hypothetical protein
MIEVSRKISWQLTLLSAAIVYFFGKMFARWIYPEFISMKMVWLSILALISLRICLEVPLGLQRMYAAKRSEEKAGKTFLAALPPEMLGHFTVALENFGAAFRLAMRMPSTRTVNGNDFLEIYPHSQYGTVFLIFLIICAAELPLTFLIIGVLEHNPEKRVLIHSILLALTILVVLWAIGDRQLVKRSSYRIQRGSLLVHIGARFEARIPLDAIEHIRPLTNPKQLSETARRWLERNGLADATSLEATPFDAPNLVLTLRPRPALRIVKNRTPVAAPRYLLLYAGRPAELIHAILVQDNHDRTGRSR